MRPRVCFETNWIATKIRYRAPAHGNSGPGGRLAEVLCDLYRGDGKVLAYAGPGRRRVASICVFVVVYRTDSPRT